MSKRRVDPIDMLLSQARILEAESHATKNAIQSCNNEKNTNSAAHVITLPSRVRAGRGKMITSEMLGVGRGRGNGRGNGRGKFFGDVNSLVVPQDYLSIGRGRGLMPPNIGSASAAFGLISAGRGLVSGDANAMNTNEGVQVFSNNNYYTIGSECSVAVNVGASGIIDSSVIVVGSGVTPILKKVSNTNQKITNSCDRGSISTGILEYQVADMASEILVRFPSDKNFSTLAHTNEKQSEVINCPEKAGYCDKSNAKMVPKADNALHLPNMKEAKTTGNHGNEFDINITKIFNELNDEVNCLYCHDTCTPPFMSCPNGHLFCSTCIKIMPGCQICTHKKIDCRQHYLEKVAMAREWPCNFRLNGCGEFLKMDKLKNHIDTCRYQIKNYCPIVGCNTGFALNKISFLKHMHENHEIKPVKISDMDLKKVHLETKYEMTDFLKKGLDLDKKIETLQIYEIGQCLFILIVQESAQDLSFINYVMGESNEHENRFFCSRRFVDKNKKFIYAIIEPMTSISGRVSKKRKYESIQNDEYAFSIKKNKLKSINNDDAMSDCDENLIIKSFIRIEFC